MKNISKPNQRELYRLYKEAVLKEASLSIQVSYDFGQNPEFQKVRQEAEEKLVHFSSFLEEGIKTEQDHVVVI